MYVVPRVSVIMPVFNGTAYLAAAINSVLAQTLPDWELIVIDDGSSDGSSSIAQAYSDPRVRVLRNPHNLGLPLTRNRGLDEARGSYVAFLDSDDIALPQRLQNQVDFLEANPGIVAVGSAVQPIDAQGMLTAVEWHCPGDAAYCKARLLFGAYFATSSITGHAQVLRENRFDPSISLAEDYDLYTRLCEKHVLVNLQQTLIQYRLHKANVTKTRRKELREALEVINMRQLNALGIQPTARELLIHRHIEWLDIAPDADLLAEVAAWLLRILRHNQRCTLYDSAALSQAASERWHAVCESALRSGHRSAWWAFYNSTLYRMRALGPVAHAKLAARLLLPHVRQCRTWQP